jgi:hypothetical protein
MGLFHFKMQSSEFKITFKNLKLNPGGATLGLIQFEIYNLKFEIGFVTTLKSKKKMNVFIL